MIAKQTLFLTEDKLQVVPEGDPEAQFLLVRGGNEISEALLDKYDLTDLGQEIYPDAYTRLEGDNGLFSPSDSLLPKNSLTPLSISSLSSSGFAKLRSLLSSQFGIQLRSTESAGVLPNSAMTRIIFQTIDASPSNPYLVNFDQFILDPFTGPGQFDLVERDSRRRVLDGTSAGGTPVLGSETMNWQPGDVDKFIRVGLNPGRVYRILSVEDPESVTLSGNITLPSTGLTLTMDGAVESEVTIATKSGYTDGVTANGWSRLVKPITVDKTYSVVFVPGTAGDGIFSISALAVYPVPPDQTPPTS